MARDPDALHRDAGRAFARRRFMDAQGARPATARRRVKGQFLGNLSHMRLLFIWLLLSAGSAHAVEIATGKMLGPGYDPRSFYLREGNSPWRRTYTGNHYRAEAAGKLMNLRIAQALFKDEYLTEVHFDPMANTRRVIQALDTYQRDGILAVNVSLQGGHMHYEHEGSIKRDVAAKAGPGKGSLVSALRPDGSLKAEWMDRLLMLQQALDKRGMVLNLIYFYVFQVGILQSPKDIDQAVRNITDWLIDHNCRNVMIEVANEYDTFDNDPYIINAMGHLIEIARERFKVKKAAFRLPISASALRDENMQLYPSVMEHGDLFTIHGNGRSPERKREWVAELVADPKVPGPVYMDEDDNGREQTTPEALAHDLASCDGVFQSGGSWGYMPWLQTQVFPFRIFDPVGDDRDSRYFRDVLEHVRKLVIE